MNAYIYAGLPQSQQKQITHQAKGEQLQHLLQQTAQTFNTTVEELKGNKRNRHIAFARHAYCLLASRTNHKLSYIGALINRQHPVVINSINKATYMLQANDPLFSPLYLQLQNLMG